MIVWYLLQPVPPTPTDPGGWRSFTAAIILAVVMSGAAGAFIQGLFTRHRLRGETLEIIQKAAGGVVQSVTEQAERVEKINDRLAARVDALEQERDEHRRLLAIHRRWDRQVMEALNDLAPGHPIPEPPPVFLPAQ